MSLHIIMMLLIYIWISTAGTWSMSLIFCNSFYLPVRVVMISLGPIWKILGTVNEIGYFIIINNNNNNEKIRLPQIIVCSNIIRVLLWRFMCTKIGLSAIWAPPSQHLICHILWLQTNQSDRHPCYSSQKHCSLTLARSCRNRSLN